MSLRDPLTASKRSIWALQTLLKGLCLAKESICGAVQYEALTISFAFKKPSWFSSNAQKYLRHSPVKRNTSEAYDKNFYDTNSRLSILILWPLDVEIGYFGTGNRINRQQLVIQPAGKGLLSNKQEIHKTLEQKSAISYHTCPEFMASYDLFHMS